MFSKKTSQNVTFLHQFKIFHVILHSQEFFRPGPAPKNSVNTGRQKLGPSRIFILCWYKMVRPKICSIFWYFFNTVSRVVLVCFFLFAFSFLEWIIIIPNGVEKNIKILNIFGQTILYQHKMSIRKGPSFGRPIFTELFGAGPGLKNSCECSKYKADLMKLLFFVSFKNANFLSCHN